ncbi:MAG: hypothetical protein HYV17_12905 [Xanthomonadales bacterium]|nr:hypothetical protein [Xanthomonadales bacterium]
MKPARLAATLTLFALAALAALPVSAANFCISDGDQLASALVAATSNEEGDEIRIEYGSLTITAPVPRDYRWKFDGRYEDYSLTISGGWSKGNGCASIATNSPDATVLDAQWGGPVFVADLRNGFAGVLTLRNLTFARGQVYYVAGPNGSQCYGAYGGIACATGLAVEAWSGSGAVVIDNVLITTGRVEAGVDAPIVHLWHQDGGSIKMRNSIIMGNTLGDGALTEGVKVRTRTNSVAYISNNSIFNNTVTSAEAGLTVDGTATLSNNAIANNSSVVATAYQYTAYNVSQQTLRDNHFGSRRFAGGDVWPFSEIGTTTGDAQWTQSGVRMVPNAESVLRDSGDNTPTGGIPSIDFSGNARIINTVIDRGAVEAAAVPPIGPSVTPNSPSSGSTTLVHGEEGESVSRIITFSVSGGNLGGTTTLFCDGIIGAAQVINGSQTISTGGYAGLVTVTVPITSSPVTHTVGCSATRSNGPIATYFFHYRVGPDLILSDGFETGP